MAFNDILLELITREFEHKVEQIFDANKRSKTHCEAPYTGERYSTEDDSLDVRQRVINALVARQRFAWSGPTWAVGLPLRWEDMKALQEGIDPGQRLVGYYAYSLQRLHWDWELHPPFKRFSSGLMAHPATPEEVRTDIRLQREFPARRLNGLEDDVLYWQTPEEIARDRRIKEYMAAQPPLDDPELLEAMAKVQPDIRHTPGHC